MFSDSIIEWVLFKGCQKISHVNSGKLEGENQKMTSEVFRASFFSGRKTWLTIGKCFWTCY